MLRFETYSWTVLSFISVLSFSGTLLAQGGGVAVYEVGTPNVGEAYAGQAAVASDASTAFLNPAGMTRLNGTQFLAGSQLDLLSAHFIAGPTTSSQRTGGNVGGMFLVPSLYLTRAISSRLSLGFSWNSPFGLGLDYSDGWAGRYAVQRIQLAVIEASPAVGYQVTRWLALGAGLSLENASFTQRTAVPNLFEPQLGDGAVDMQLHGWGTGFRAGALVNAGTRTRIGLTYRSEVDFSLNGKVVPSNISPAMMAVLPPLPSSGIPLSLAQGANASIYHDWNRKVALLADAGWADWQRFGRQESKAPDGSTVITDRHWKDTWRVGLGLRWQAGRRTMLHAGASYDSSPVSNRDRTPDLPIDRQWRFAAGVTRDPKPFLSVSLSCSYTALGSAHIEKFLGPIAGRLSGQYGAARLPFVSLSFDFHSSAGVEGRSRD